MMSAVQMACTVLLVLVLLTRGTLQAKVLQQFTDPSTETKFRHLLYNHDTTDHLYIGAINRVYHLGSDLRPAHSAIQTGPKQDHLNCQPKNGSCICLATGDDCTKQPMDSYNQALAINKQGDVLYACSNLFYGSCSIIRLSGFMELEQSYKPIISNDISEANSTTVMLVAPGIDDRFGNLYVGTTRSSVGSAQITELVPMVASRSLSNFNLAHDETGTSSSVKPLHRFKDNFKVYYKFAYSHEGFSYFLTVQKTETNDPFREDIPYVSRILRVCQKDAKFMSYVEVPFQCVVEGIDAETFNIVQSASIGRPGSDISEALSLAEGEEALFAVFTSGEQFSHRPKAPSAVCIYSLTKIADMFKKNQDYCFKGYGKTGPPHITTPIGCFKTRYDKFECAERAVNYPIQGQFGAVRTPITFRVGAALSTSIVAKGVDKFTVVYVGDNTGHLTKFVVYYYKESLETRAAMFSNVTIDPDGSAIQRDMALDITKQHLYMMSENKVYKVQLSDCPQYSTCNTCKGSGDPHCGWCSSMDRCTSSAECRTNDHVWIDITQNCPNIRQIEPEQLPYSSSGSAPVTLTLMELPTAKDNEMRCQIQSETSDPFLSRVSTDTFKRTLKCEGFVDGLPPVTGATGSINTTLTIVISGQQWISTDIAVYDCTKYYGCAACTSVPYPCGWCVLDNACVQEAGSCAQPGPLIISNAVNVFTAHIVESSSHGTIFTATCPMIEPIEDQYDVPEGHGREIRVGAKNIKLWTNSDGESHSMGMSCVYSSPDGEITTSATVQEDGFADEGVVTCQETKLEYIQDKGMVNFPLDVIWEFGHKLENPRSVEVSVYKCSAMVNNCGKCLALDSRYKCGWCQTVCTLQEDCPNWLDKGSVCPNPVILRFEPSAGPINGGTELTVHGINLGRTPDDLMGNVKVAGQPCDVQTTGYVESNSFVCETNPAEGATSGPVSVSVVGKYDYITSIEYRYTTPIFTGLHPDKGLITGNNLVTVYGTDLALGSAVRVYINSQPVAAEWRNDSHLMFRTPKVDSPMMAPLVLEVDATEYSLDIPFSYLPHPQILAISPLFALVSGGNLINITGTNFDGVQQARVELSEQLENLLVECTVIDAENLQYITPDVTSLHLNIDENKGLPLSYEFQMDELIITKEDMEKTMDYKPIALVADPTIYDLEEDEHTVDYTEGIIVYVKGYNLRIFRYFPDWKVLVGGTVCPRFRVDNFDNTLEITPPAEPQMLSGSGLAEIEVRLGNFAYRPGFVRYEQPSENKVPLILGLVFGLVLPIILAILLIIICLRRQSRKNGHKKRSGLLGDNRGSYQPASILPSPTEMQADVHNECEEEQGLIAESPATPDGDTEPDSAASVRQNPDYIERLLNKIDNKKLRSAVAEVVISRERITIGDVLGHGHFGCVYLAMLKDDNLKNPKKVAVKTLQGEDFPPHMVTSFLEEGVVMKTFQHPHVLQLLGVGVGETDEPMVIIPFMAQGDLRTYVRNKEKSFTARQLLQLAQQVAKGMAYLSSLHFVHRDLAARNCMIDEENTVKVADFGLSKNLFEKDYYSSTRDRKTKLPVKWMALESLEEFRFTIKSDVWSFGVLMWELMTRGTTPYPDIDIFDLRTFLAEGRRLQKPKYCPEHVYNIMGDCWNKYPEARPTFADLVNRLELLLNPPKKRDPTEATAEPMYVNFNDFDNTEYLNPISAPAPDTPDGTLQPEGLPLGPPLGPPLAPPPSPPRTGTKGRGSESVA